MAKIIYIEDDDNVRYAISKLLTKNGHSVIEATNGFEGIELIKKSEVDIVLTDIVMPVMEGMELIAHLVKEYPGLPIIAISGGPRFGTTDYLTFATRMGATEILPKPINEEKLLEYIERHTS